MFWQIILDIDNVCSVTLNQRFYSFDSGRAINNRVRNGPFCILKLGSRHKQKKHVLVSAVHILQKFWCRQVRNHQLYVFNFHHHRIHQLSTTTFFQKRKKLQNVFSRLINVQITWKTWFCIFVKTKNTSKRFYFIEKTLQNMCLICKRETNSKLSSTKFFLT